MRTYKTAIVNSYRNLSWIMLTCTLCVQVGSLRAQSIGQKADAAMRRVFGQCTEYRTVTLPIDPTLAARVATRTGQAVGAKVIVHEAVGEKGIVGYGIVDDVRGKAQPITYITLLRPDATIAEIEILVYREPYGGEVQYETFRRQFRGKRPESPLRIGQDIQNIAGATISSKAVTVGAKKIATLFEELRAAKKL